MTDMPHRDYLKRLPRVNYQGRAQVHWTLTIDQRRQGWLDANFYYKFRELLTHTLFRYGLTCPVYCCMPDHLHLLWLGIFESTDQINAMRYFRRQLNLVLGKIGFGLQKQAYDNVAKDDARKQAAFESLCEYIARNPERKSLVARDGYAKYPFTDCLVPGAPSLRFFQEDFWETFWQLYSRHQREGLMKGIND